MGCQYCKPIEQIADEYEEEKEEVKEEIDELKLDFRIARKHVKLLLTENKLYKKAVNYVIFFTDEEFENLFKGNLDYKKYPYRNIPDQEQFKYLLLKFEDFNEVLYEFYKDEDKYDDLIRVFDSDMCISELTDLSVFELDERLKKFKLTDLDYFITECLSVINNSTNKKAVDIRNYLRDEFTDFYSLIQVTNDYKKEFDKSQIQNKEVMTTNLDNIAHKLIEKSMPLVKDYIAKKFPNLNILSKIELKSGMLNKLKKALFEEINNDKSQNAKKVCFNVVKNIVNSFQNGNGASKIFNQGETGTIAMVASAFLNLATSVKTYYDEKIEYDETNKKYTHKLEQLHNEFEMLKNQIGILDLDNYEESMAKIIQIGKNMNLNKQKISIVIKDLKHKEKEIKEKKTGSTLKRVASSAAGAVSLTIAAATTGGLIIPILAGAGAIGSAIDCGINIAKLKKLKDQLDKFGKTKEKESQHYLEIDEQIEILRKKYEKIKDRYIPKNLLKG